MKYFDASRRRRRSPSPRAVVAAAPEDQKENWQALVDAQKKVAENARELVEPANFKKFKAMSKNDRDAHMFEILFGPLRRGGRDVHRRAHQARQGRVRRRSPE